MLLSIIIVSNISSSALNCACMVDDGNTMALILSIIIIISITLANLILNKS